MYAENAGRRERSQEDKVRIVAVLSILLSVAVFADTGSTYQKGTLTKETVEVRSYELKGTNNTVWVKPCGDFQSGQAIEFRIVDDKAYIRRDNGGEYKCSITMRQVPSETGASPIYQKESSLPDSCGSEDVSFTIAKKAHQPVPPGPKEDQAQIVFIENENLVLWPFMNATVRFGIDGSWVGATNGNSYFAVTISPGTHHLCAFWKRKNLQLTSLAAEPGKIYYFEAQVNVESRDIVGFGLSQLNADEGKYQASNSKLSISKAQ